MDQNPDALTKPFGNESSERSSSGMAAIRRRRLIGRPRVWVSTTGCGVGVVWLVLAALEPAAWRFVIGGIYLLLGLAQLAVAVSDRRHQRGYYGEAIRGGR